MNGPKRWASAALSLVMIAGSSPGQVGPFRVEPDDRGVWSFVDSTGMRFISVGISNVSPLPYAPRPNTDHYRAAETQFGGDERAWGADAAALLRDHGFNTIGAWSSPVVPAGQGLVRTPVLYVAGHAPDRTLEGLRPGFVERARAVVREELARYEGGSASWLGVFLDNEAAWWGKSPWDRIPTYTLLERALELPKDDAARAAAIEFLKSRHAGSVEAFGKAWGRPLASWDGLTFEYVKTLANEATQADRAAFVAHAADRWFEQAAAAVRAEAPGVLILGTRFATDAPPGVIEAAGRFCDVVSFNRYTVDPAMDTITLAEHWVRTKKPVMITEFSWRSRENQSGNPNTRGAGAVVQTQDERARNYAAFFADAVKFPGVVGLHWFQFFDESPQGRFDGEDGNYGVVDIRNGRYEALLAAMRASHAKLGELRSGDMTPMPTELASGTITYRPGQHPDRPSVLELVGPKAGEPTRGPDLWHAPDAKVEIATGPAGGFVVTLDAGELWGVGVNWYGPASMRLPRGLKEGADLDGYEWIVVEAEVPGGLEFQVNVYEAGSADHASPTFDTTAGDDGEAWNSLPMFGTGKNETYRVRISQLIMPKYYGNQRGAKRIDMQALRAIGLQIQGSPRQSKVVVRSLRLEK
jgi:hypothetical protein